MNLYNEKIDEFVDWISGRDSITAESRIDIGPGRTYDGISGKVIRELIQSHLKKPLVRIDGGLVYRLFSSEEAYRRWDLDREANADLLLLEYPKPSSYHISVDGLGNTKKYITKSASSEETSISFDWVIENDKHDVQIDVLQATYIITTPSGKTYSKVETYEYDPKNSTSNYSHCSFSVEKYLEVGDNIIEVKLVGESSEASTSFKPHIVVLDLQISSDFQFYRTHTKNLMLFSSSNSGVGDRIYINGQYADDADIAVYIYIDGVQKYKENLNKTLTIVSPTIINDYDPGAHNLEIIAIMDYNDKQFKSNVLYYTFINESTIYDTAKFISKAVSFYGGIAPFNNDFELLATLYEKCILEWGYFTNNLQLTSADVTWKLLDGNQTIELTNIRGNKGEKSDNLEFIPPIYTKTNKTYLVAFVDNVEINRIPINISQGSLDIKETSNYDLKLSAYGRSNSSATKDVWEFEGSSVGTVTTDFNGIAWDESSGWYNNSLRVSGLDQYAIINYNPLANAPQTIGRTIEIEFESEKVVNDDDIIMLLGDQNNARIEITPTSASLFDSGNRKQIYTNFKSNERIKLSFVIPGNGVYDNDKTLLYISNNGILERAALKGGYVYEAATGNIKIGGSASGIRVYSVKVYQMALTYRESYNNFVFDSENKTDIILRNNVLDEGNISYTACINKLDTILIEGNLTDLLNPQSGKDAETNVKITRRCPFDPTGSSDFVGENIRIRKHGQSTLRFPISSMKFWLNKSSHDIGKPILIWNAGSKYQFAKNRYIMKKGAIPSNKFVLLANYADSSGVHNGSILQIINDTWYNATFTVNGQTQHLLRTDPQLFASGETALLNPGVENRENIMLGKNSEGKTWKDYYPNNPFPYQIRNAPDSFPCVVFYRNTGTDERIFLGQYVFMDDKKSDYLYGERSIYSFPTDPFCLTKGNKDKDTNDRKLWDNSKVLRIEDVNIDNNFTSFLSTINGNGLEFELKIVTVLEEENNTTIEQYAWEADFELIYPDPDDVVGHNAGDPKKNGGVYETTTTKFSQNSEFVEKTKPFVYWFKWLVATKNDYAKNTLNEEWAMYGETLGKENFGWPAGTYSSAQQCFEATAPKHLDLYKLAAYYIFFLRLGLVDSVERNAQLKTYDGLHWHYEPWDMDIALGNKNTGGIEFNPPIDRNSKWPSDPLSYAFSGRSSSTSNWLWDALEAWIDWRGRIVRETSAALYNAGLNYETLSKKFDEDFAEKWCEVIYNQSGYFKYVTARGNDNKRLLFLLGARTTHRHWWLSTSMNYYDAKWKVGEFTKNVIRVFTVHSLLTEEGEKDAIIIRPNATTFFLMMMNDENSGQTVITPKDALGNATDGSADREHPVVFDLTTEAITSKQPLNIYGSTYIEELDISGVAQGLSSLELGGSYSSVLGAAIKVLNAGIRYTKTNDNEYIGLINAKEPSINSSVFDPETGISTTDSTIDALENIITLNLRGQSGFDTYEELYSLDRSRLQNFYAMGGKHDYFYSSVTGNRFGVLELPGINKYSDGTIYSSLSSIELHNSSWEDISFWDGVIDINTNQGTFTKCNIENDYSLNIPSSLQSVKFKGTTGKRQEAKDFIFNWIDCIVEREGEEGIATKTLEIDNIYWENISFDDLHRLAMFNGGINETGHSNNANGNNLKGYVVLDSNEQLDATKLSQIRGWFGDSVFTPGSLGLVVDLYTGDLIINVGPAAEIINGELYLAEGFKASLNATKFKLSADGGRYGWLVGAPGSSAMSSRGYKDVILLELGGVMYLIANESLAGEDYDVQIQCVSFDDTSVLIGSPIIIHIISALYPISYNFGISPINWEDLLNIGQLNNNAKLINNLISFWGDHVGSELYIEPVFENPDSINNATINDVIFKISNESNNNILTISYKSFNSNTGEEQCIESGNDKFAYVLLSSDVLDLGRYDISLFSKNTASLEENELNYNLDIIVKFKSGKEEIITKNILVTNDGQIIFSSTSNFALYNVIGPAYASAIGADYNTTESFYKTELKALNNSLTFLDYTGDFLTITNESIFKYLVNLLTLNLIRSTIISDMFNSGYTPILKSITFNNNTLSGNYLYLPDNIEQVNISGSLGDISITGAQNHKIKDLKIQGEFSTAYLAEIYDKFDNSVERIALYPSTGYLNISYYLLLKLLTFFQKVINNEITVTNMIGDISYNCSNILLLSAKHALDINNTINLGYSKIKGSDITISYKNDSKTQYFYMISSRTQYVYLQNGVNPSGNTSGGDIAALLFLLSNGNITRNLSGSTVTYGFSLPQNQKIYLYAKDKKTVSFSLSITFTFSASVQLGGNLTSLWDGSDPNDELKNSNPYLYFRSADDTVTFDLSNLYMPVGFFKNSSGYSSIFNWANISVYPTLYFGYDSRAYYSLSTYPFNLTTNNGSLTAVIYPSITQLGTLITNVNSNLRAMVKTVKVPNINTLSDSSIKSTFPNAVIERY